MEDKTSILNITYASSDSYAYIAGVSIISLLENAKRDKQINIHFFMDNVSKENQNKLLQIANAYNQKISFYDVNAIVNKMKDMGVKGIAEIGDFSFTTYARIMVANQMPPNVKKMIFIDCDTLILKDISEMLVADMQEKPIGMILDCVRQEYKQVVGFSKSEPYFNAGIILFDVERWKKEKYEEQILNHIQNERAYYPLVDQDILNIVLKNKIFRMKMNYNLQSQCLLYSDCNDIYKVYNFYKGTYYNYEEFAEARNQPSILHFCGSTFIRPWYKKSRHPYKEVWQQYYKMSPWKDIMLQDGKWLLPYKVQYMAYRYFPAKLNTFFGAILQTIFVSINYGTLKGSKKNE